MLTDLGRIVDGVVGALARPSDVPFALFGHSMGALLAFEVARALRRRGLPAPRALVVSAFPAPGVEQAWPDLHVAPDAVLIDELRELGGTPEAAMDPELLELVLPIFRADLTAVETWSHVPEPPFAFPIHALGGTRDARVSRDDLARWSAHTTGDFSLQLFDGDHFFVSSRAPRVTDALRARLLAVAGP